MEDQCRAGGEGKLQFQARVGQRHWLGRPELHREVRARACEQASGSGGGACFQWQPQSPANRFTR